MTMTSLIDKGVRVHELNMEVLDDTATGRLIRNIMLCFADFERAMIIERTGEGREIASQNPLYNKCCEGNKHIYYALI